ncbi:MAG: GatB/YqeY protein [Gammaproteobacteria bacterium]|jgi:uncharacterized protein YqeY|nr:GatB/YqeY protein [Gammaproteobacteria bacterium]
MSLKATLMDAMKTAMRAQDKARLEVIRLIQASIKQVEVDQGKRDEGLNDAEVLAVLDKMVKQRRDAIEQFVAGSRQDLADKERHEVSVIQEFLPQPLSEDEIEAHIKEAIAATGAKVMADMSKVMTELKPKLQGRADMGKVSAKIKALLG